MYTAISDPYCYQDTDILINIPGIINEEILGEFEAAITTQRAYEGFPTGDFDITHYKSIHYHLFQDIYIPGLENIELFASPKILHLFVILKTFPTKWDDCFSS